MSPSTVRAPAARRRSTQAERSARTRSALFESAARGLSRYGYGNLVLEQVAREAGYTRGALYHQFEDKEDLALAVVEWVDETWWREVGGLVEQQPDPVTCALARGHAVYCRRDVARVMMALRVEFSGQEHPVGREVERISRTLVKRCARLIDAGRRDGSIPPGPPARAVALAFLGARGRGRARAGQSASTPIHLMDRITRTRATARTWGSTRRSERLSSPGDRLPARLRDLRAGSARTARRWPRSR
jgi:AcrR family transcriptional regulator